MAKSKERNDEATFKIPKVFPPKLPDQGSFSLPCVIGKVKIEIAICDIGASVSLMPYFMFHNLHLGPLRLAPFSLQLADGFKMRPLGKLEDEPVKMGDIWVLKHFAKIDMTKIDDAQIILGRPFLAISGCNINVKRGG